MRLSRVDQERVNDSRLKLQSVASALSNVDSAKVPGLEEIQECLENASQSLRGALRVSHSEVDSR